MIFGPSLLLVGMQSEWGGELVFSYHTYRAGRFIRPIRHEKSSTFLYWRRDQSLQRLGQDHPEDIETPWPTYKPSKKHRSLQFSETDPTTGDVLFSYPKGLARFDGERVYDIPEWSSDRLSVYTRIIWLAGKRYARNSDGLFALNTELRLTPIPLPLGLNQDSEHFINLFSNYDESGTFGLIFLTNPRDGRVFTTKDFVTFEQVRNDTGSKITDFVSDIPEEDAALFIGSGGLYSVVYCNGRSP